MIGGRSWKLWLEDGNKSDWRRKIPLDLLTSHSVSENQKVYHLLDRNPLDVSHCSPKRKYICSYLLYIVLIQLKTDIKNAVFVLHFFAPYIIESINCFFFHCFTSWLGMEYAVWKSIGNKLKTRLWHIWVLSNGWCGASGYHTFYLYMRCV